MPLVQQLAVDALQLVQSDGHGTLQQIARRAGFLHPREHRGAIGVLRPLAEHVTVEVAGEPDAGREDDAALRPGRVEPAHAAVGKEKDVDHSSTRMRSSSSAASPKFSFSTARRSCYSTPTSRTRGPLATPAPLRAYHSPSR